MEDENKSKNITSRWRRMPLAGRSCSQKQRWLGNKDGDAHAGEARGDVTAPTTPDKDDGDKLRFQTAVFQDALLKEEPRPGCLYERRLVHARVSGGRASICHNKVHMSVKCRTDDEGDAHL